MANRFEQHPRLTLFIISIITLLILLIGFEKILGARLTGGNSDEIVRHIRLREHSPLLQQKMRPDAGVLASSDDLPDKAFSFSTDINGYIQPSLIHEKADSTIAFIGGSTTECMFIDEDKRFPYLVGQLLETNKFKVNTINSGVSGNDSLHSIDIFLNKIIADKPNIAVLMHNINDLSVLLYEKSYWNDNDYRSPLIVEDRSIKSFIKQLLPNTYELLYRLKTNLAGQIDEFKDIRGKKLTINRDQILDQFGSNLEIFVNTAKAKHIQPVLMTQANRFTEKPDATILKNLAALKSLGVSYQDYRDIYRAMNKKIRQVATANNVLLIDLEAQIPQTREYMYDPVHFTDKGSVAVANIIANTLRDSLQQQTKPK